MLCVKLGMNKRKRKILFRIFTALIVGVPLLFVIFLQLVVFQTFVANSLVQNISKKMGGEIVFGSIYLSPFTGVNIHNLYIEDDKKDTLVFIENLVVDLKSFDIKESKIHLNSVELENGFYNLYSINEREQTNMQYIINYFSNSDTLSSGRDFFLNIENVSISDLRFRYKKNQPDSVNFGLNFGDIDLSRLNLEMNDFKMINDSMVFNLEKLSIDESSGFKLTNLMGQAIVSPSEISVSHMVLKTPSSHVFAYDCSLKYGEWIELGDFFEKVDVNLNLQLSAVNISDIAYFAPVFQGLDIPTFAQGRIYGRISKLKSKRFLLSLGDNSRIETSFSLEGLPDYEQAFLNLNIKDIYIESKDVELLLKRQKNDVAYQLPNVLREINSIHYSGDITGFLTDLVAYGTFDNSKGLVNTDLRFKYNPQNKSYLYSGRLKTHNLDLSVLNLTDTVFENISMSGNVLAQIDSSNNVSGHLDGNVFSIGINKYQYRNISFDANLDRLILSSKVEVNDSNLVLNIDSKIDFSLEEPYFDFISNVKKANLSKLNCLDRDSSSYLSFSAEAQFSSIKLDKFFGELTIKDLEYSELDNRVIADEIHLHSSKKQEIRSVVINSDLFDADFKGHFLSQNLKSHFISLYNLYLPAFAIENVNKVDENQDIELNINLKNTYSIFEIFSPSLLLANKSKIHAFYNSNKENLDFHFTTDSCRIYNNVAENVDLKLKGNFDEIYSDLIVENLSILDEFRFNNFNLKNKLKSDSLNVYLSWMDKNRQEESAEILVETIFHPSSFDSLSFDVNLIPSYLFIEDSIWYINDAHIAIRGEKSLVESLIINRDSQYLYVDGSWQKGKSDSLQILLNKVNLAYFPYLEKKTSLKMRALVDGDIVLSHKGETPLVSGYLRADSLSINNELLGDLMVETSWETEKDRLILDAVNKMGKKNFECLTSHGYVDFNTKSINLDIGLNKQKLSFFSPFLEDYISDIKGYVSGNLNINGPFDGIQYYGDLKFSRAKFTYDYLGTRYNFTDQVKIEKDRFIFEDLKVFQVNGEGDYATINGYITHQDFSNFNFFVDIDAKNFMLLNTTPKDNELFYGTAFLTGLVEFTGTDQNLNIDISGTTNKDTHFYIPLSDEEEASGSGFISFVGDEKTHVKEEDYKLDLSGIVLNFDLKVTPDAEVQLIFDEQLGDIVKAKGYGDINLNINTLGNFTMNGIYTIEKGEYLFTLQNVINKKFKIEEGSDIKWNGDPYQAYVDLKADYNLRTPLYDLTLREEDKERIPIKCKLKMKNHLMSPEIAFDIELPTSKEQAKSILDAMTQDEKTVQLLSLLVLSKFYTPDYLRGGEEISSGNAVGKNASELLSNQLSNWLSQMSDDFDIGVNYRPGDEVSNDEWEVALSTQLFNNRVAVDGNIGVSDYQNTNTNVVGNVNVDVKVNKKGNVRVRGFNRVNENEIENSSLYTQGVGLYYREDFDSFGELLTKYWQKMTFSYEKDSVQ